MKNITFYSSLFDFLDGYSEAVLIGDKSSKIVYVNKAFRKLCLLKSDELPSGTVSHFFKLKVNIKGEDGEGNLQWESNLSRTDGSTVWIKVSTSPFISETGDTLTVYTLTTNTTLEQLQSLLKESEKRFETLADASPVMIWMTDKNNLTYYFNKSWLDFRGRTFEEEMGIGWLQGVHPDDMGAFRKISEFLERFEHYSCEYRLKDHNGVYKSILEIGTPRFLPDKTFAGYMGSCLDISEMKSAQQELAGYTKELKRSNEELENFAYVASHDMQEPLRMIASYTQLIQKGIETNRTEGLTEFMKYVTDGVTRMQSLISDLLQFSRVNSKGSAFAEVNMQELLSVVTTNISEKIKETGAVVKIADGMPTLQADRTQLMRLFQNLMENAIKFRSPERKPIIEISVEDTQGFFIFHVKDNGIGIEKKFYNRIFVIFQRLHTRDEYEGTGIGLAVCKKIVERHGGDIKVESVTNEGSEFIFSLRKQHSNNGFTE
ncbi:MAG: PAS domain S-box protein [Bacteroidetes bacterium]|nr:PAS domain S-box protein [Bacteroidota bacterium]